MRIEDGRESSNVEDRRGMRFGGKSIGLGTIVLALVAMYFGVDPSIVLQGGAPAVSVERQGPAPAPPADDAAARFVSQVLADTEDTWRELFKRNGMQYHDPTLVLFSDATPTACGTGQAAMGPFYCPGDQKVYIDLSFYRDLQTRFRAPGQMAQAYVIAHEVGHHVQNQLGIADKVRQLQSQARDQAHVNALSVRMELQADCFAGIWAYHAKRTRQIIEQGDLESALTAAAAIGDDRLQRQTQGRIVPESFTHGTSEQRVRWFRRGFDSGDLRQCNTFSGPV
ncbi:MAG: neutral zinc metallopeptidase [Burkholderiales bacterium]|nr:neutral zinc metallopeptidase [Burkholderiales bacterium]